MQTESSSVASTCTNNHEAFCEVIYWTNVKVITVVEKFLLALTVAAEERRGKGKKLFYLAYI